MITLPQFSYTTCHYQPNNGANAIDEEDVTSAGDEEHDVLRAWRIIERSGVMNHAYLDPSSRHVSN